jgi:hypothetical protein
MRQGSQIDRVRVGQDWEQVSKHERGTRLQVVRGDRASLGAAARRRRREQEARLAGGPLDLEHRAGSRPPVDLFGTSTDPR